MRSKVGGNDGRGAPSLETITEAAGKATTTSWQQLADRSFSKEGLEQVELERPTHRYGELPRFVAILLRRTWFQNWLLIVIVWRLTQIFMVMLGVLGVLWRCA